MHLVTGEVAPVVLEAGRLFVVSKAGRVPFQTARDWSYHSLLEPLTAPQRAQVMHAADVALRQVLGERCADFTWHHVGTDERVQWIEGTLPLKGVRAQVAEALREVLEKLEVEA